MVITKGNPFIDKKVTIVYKHLNFRPTKGLQTIWFDVIKAFSLQSYFLFLCLVKNNYGEKQSFIDKWL